MPSAFRLSSVLPRSRAGATARLRRSGRHIGIGPYRARKAPDVSAERVRYSHDFEGTSCSRGPTQSRSAQVIPEPLVQLAPALAVVEPRIAVRMPFEVFAARLRKPVGPDSNPLDAHRSCTTATYKSVLACFRANSPVARPFPEKRTFLGIGPTARSAVNAYRGNPASASTGTG